MEDVRRALAIGQRGLSVAAGRVSPLPAMLGRWLLLALAGVAISGCSTIQEIAALRSVHFELDRVGELRLAGIDVTRTRSASDLSVGDGLRMASALASGELPLSFRLHLRAENPAGNSISARLVRMQWTLFLEERETVSGQIDREYELAPGRPTDIPVDISLDLLEFYDRNAEDLVEFASNLAGAGGRPMQIALRATPIIDTALGPIRYPRPITIVAGSVGSAELMQPDESLQQGAVDLVAGL